MATCDSEGNCYRNEGYLDSEPGCPVASAPVPADPCPLVAVPLDQAKLPSKTKPQPLPPSSPTVSCKTQMSALSLDMPTCRICQDSRATDKLVSPCGCSGSSKFVHRKCLLKWIMLKGGEACEICQKPYDKKITHGTVFTPSEENTIASSIVVLLLLLGVTSVGVYLMVDHVLRRGISPGVSVWVPISLLFVGLLGLAVFLPWLVVFCVRTSRRHDGDTPLTRFHRPVLLHL